MVLTSHLCFVIVITTFIEISPIWAWIVNDRRRYDGYDLEKGPVFYEAYYPENNENSPTEYQEKRYFDRDAVLERTFQVPTNQGEYPVEDRLENEYPNRLERIRYNEEHVIDPKFFIEGNYAKIEPSMPYEVTHRSYNINPFLPTYAERTQDIPRDSKLLPKDFESWNSLENDLHLDSSPDRRRNFDKSDIDGSNFRLFMKRDQFLPVWSNIFEKRNRDDREMETLREIRKNLAMGSSKPIQPLELSKHLESMRKRLSLRDVQNRDPIESIDSISYSRYPRQQFHYFSNTNEREAQKWIPDVKSLPNQQMEVIPRTIESLTSENIFAPRPQVINYVFSKGSTVEKTEKPMTMMEMPKSEEPRKYGDNLLQEQLKKVEGEKDKSAKVTSIEISEAPRHKIRHHHGEWLRDFSRGSK